MAEEEEEEEFLARLAPVMLIYSSRHTDNI
jgi:hypothetical protein